MGFSPFFFGVNKIMLNKRADKLELLRIAEAVALEKSIDKELIISSMETGIAKAAKSKFGQENEIKVSINRDNGDIELFRKLIIAENPENTNTEIKNISTLERSQEYTLSMQEVKKQGYDSILGTKNANTGAREHTPKPLPSELPEANDFLNLRPQLSFGSTFV